MTAENETRTREVVESTPWLILLTILLLIGKTVGWWANMSWLWVFSPLWLPFAMVAVIMALMALFAVSALVVIALMSWWEN